jgi:hypothetical protein
MRPSLQTRQNPWIRAEERQIRAPAETERHFMGRFQAPNSRTLPPLEARDSAPAF